MPINENVCIVLVWNGSTITIYINSSVNRRNTYSNQITPANPNCKFYMADPWHPCDGFQIKDFIIHDKSLSESEVKDIYDKGNSPDNSNSPIGCGKFNFCVAKEDNTAYCYGSSSGCLWGSNDCTNDSQCSKYNRNTSKKFTDQGHNCNTFTSVNEWQMDTCLK